LETLIFSYAGCKEVASDTASSMDPSSAKASVPAIFIESIPPQISRQWITHWYRPSSFFVRGLDKPASGLVPRAGQTRRSVVAQPYTLGTLRGSADPLFYLERVFRRKIPPLLTKPKFHPKDTISGTYSTTSSNVTLTLGVIEPEARYVVNSPIGLQELD
jgi:hypothetical protein